MRAIDARLKRSEIFGKYLYYDIKMGDLSVIKLTETEITFLDAITLRPQSTEEYATLLKVCIVLQTCMKENILCPVFTVNSAKTLEEILNLVKKNFQL